MVAQEISDLQKRRADNIVWGCAEDYSFIPDFKAYDRDGKVDIYWNALEPVLYEAEVLSRPVLKSIRPEPAESELKFDAGMSTDEIVATAREFFSARYGLSDSGKIRRGFRLPHLRRI